MGLWSNMVSISKFVPVPPFWYSITSSGMSVEFLAESRPEQLGYGS